MVTPSTLTKGLSDSRKYLDSLDRPTDQRTTPCDALIGIPGPPKQLSKCENLCFSTTQVSGLLGDKVAKNSFADVPVKGTGIDAHASTTAFTLCITLYATVVDGA